MIPPVQIVTVIHDDESPRRLTVNRADRSDDNVVVSFDGQNADGRRTHREAIGLAPDAAIEFAIALLNAAQEVKA